MATYDDMSLKERLFMKAYPFSRYTIDPVPLARLEKPLNLARVALVTTGGLHPPDQPRFASMAIGDQSFREIPDSIDAQSLVESHTSGAFDHLGVKLDKNLIFPLDRFRELVERGMIGELNHRHFSFMGSVLRPGKLVRETAPQVARSLREDGVDAVFLTPA
jgi:D-proline reductase (dithiol) PrdB